MCVVQQKEVLNHEVVIKLRHYYQTLHIHICSTWVYTAHILQFYNTNFITCLVCNTIRFAYTRKGVSSGQQQAINKVGECTSLLITWSIIKNLCIRYVNTCYNVMLQRWNLLYSCYMLTQTLYKCIHMFCMVVAFHRVYLLFTSTVRENSWRVFPHHEKSTLTFMISNVLRNVTVLKLFF